MAKMILYGDEARKKIQDGVDKLARAVRTTLGPRGKVVILHKGTHVFTLDGVTVAKDIFLSDPFENVGSELVKEVAWKTDKEAGDGTTTATILCQTLLREGMKAVAAGIDRNVMKKGMEEAARAVVAHIKKIAKPIRTKKQIADVATISSRDPKIGEVVSEIMEEAGRDCVIAVEESHIPGLFKEIVQGLKFGRGWITPYMADQRTGEAVLEKPYILVTTQNLKENQEIVRLLEVIAHTDKKSVLVICDQLAGEALPTFVLNKIRGVVNSVVVTAPGFGDNKNDQLGDIAVITGGVLIGEETATRVADIDLEQLGRADRVVVTKESTIIIGGAGSKKDIQNRIASIETAVEKEISDYKKEQLRERLGKLKGGVAVIRVGAQSEAESNEQRYRIEDAVRSTRSAVDEGIVPGGGIALLSAARGLETQIREEKDISYRMGLQVVHDAIRDPAAQIIENTGVKPDVILNEILKSKLPNFGYNAATGEYGDLLKLGVIDPAKVVRVALENAVSIIGLFLITEAIVEEEPEKDKTPKTE